MAKDFRNMSKLPDDFITLSYSEYPEMESCIEDEYGREEADRLYQLVLGSCFSINSNMIGVRKAVETAAMEALKENNKGLCIDDITIEVLDPCSISYCKDGKAFAWRYGQIDVNEKYMDRDSDEGEYPIIPSDEYEMMGCSWIENGDPSWEEFEQVEKALNKNKTA